jgi:hypothetical protein
LRFAALHRLSDRASKPACRGRGIEGDDTRNWGGVKPRFSLDAFIIWFYNQIMLTVVETPEFLAWARRVWSDDERDAFVDWIARHPDAGEVIPQTNGLRKLRFSRQGMGKQGGARVIYFLRRPEGQIVLLLVYAKAKFDNLRAEFLKKLKEQYDV